MILKAACPQVFDGVCCTEIMRLEGHAYVLRPFVTGALLMKFFYNTCIDLHK